MAKGPYAVMMKMPPGFDSGWHTHDFDYTGVVLAGTIENIEQGGEAASKSMPKEKKEAMPAPTPSK